MRSLKKTYQAAPVFFILLMLGNIVMALLGYVPRIISKSVLNMLQNGEPLEEIIRLIISLVCVALITEIVESICSVVSLRHNNLFNQAVDGEILAKNARLNISCYDTPEYYNTINGLTRSKRSFGRLKEQSLRFLAAAINLAINIAVVTYYSSFLYVLIMFLFIIPAVFLSGKYETKTYQYEMENRGVLREASYYARVITGRVSAQEIRFYGLSDYFVEKYEKLSTGYRDGVKKIGRKYGVLGSLAKVLPCIGTCIVLMAAAVHVVFGKMLVGDFIFLISAVSGLQVHFSQIIFNLSTVDVNCHAAKIYEEYLALPEISNNGKRQVNRIDSIEFCDVSFCYPHSNEVVLNHVSFAINPTERTALIGINGAGKTTIAKLLMRFYPVDEGEILINGVNINDYDLYSLRRMISPVFQNYSIYSLSLGFNVSLSFEYEDKKDRMEAALRNAGLGDLPALTGFDYTIELSKRFSNEGIVLSGGQNQKIAIARSLFQEAQYFILDEPSAALDPLAEAQILRQFHEAYKNNGILMITHRISNTEQMDWIIVLENGSVLECGSHEELLHKNGRYCELLMMQEGR